LPNPLALTFNLPNVAEKFDLRDDLDKSKLSNSRDIHPFTENYKKVLKVFPKISKNINSNEFVTDKRYKGDRRKIILEHDKIMAFKKSHLTEADKKSGLNSLNRSFDEFSEQSNESKRMTSKFLKKLLKKTEDEKKYQKYSNLLNRPSPPKSHARDKSNMSIGTTSSSLNLKLFNRF
jgi:hypothetical protein